MRKVMFFVFALSCIFVLLGAGGGIPVTSITPGTAAGQCITTDGAVAYWGSCATSDGGTTSPGGSANEVQINNGAGAFGGATNVTSGTGFLAVGPNPPTSGELRLKNASSITFSDAAHTTDIAILWNDSSNNIYFGGDPQATSIQIGHNSIPTIIGGSTITLGAGSPLIFNGGSNAATTGSIRFASNSTIYFRNNVGSADVLGFSKDSSDRVIVGDTGSNSYVRVTAAGDTTVSANGTINYTAGSSQSHLFSVGGSQKFAVNASTSNSMQPILGDSSVASPYAVHGEASVDCSTNCTPSASVYKYATIRVTGTGTGSTTVTLPSPGSDANAYHKFVKNGRAGSIVVTYSGNIGGTVNFSPGANGVVVLDTSDGVVKIAP